MKLNLLARACDPDRLDSFLGGELNDTQEHEFHLHLNTCANCRRLLQERAAEPEAWREAEELLRPSQFVSQLADDSENSSLSHRSKRQPLQIHNVLAALGPTDDPAMLGRLGGYEVSGVVGAGGMGVVLKAIDKSLDRTVAIKVLAPHLATSGAARKRFAREAKAAAAVLHPNVIAIHSVSNDESLPYLVMPYVRGTSLQKRLDKEGPLSLQEILRIGSQIAAGLAAAHAQGLVHRDIKPANILLEDGVERVTITDFGLARAVDDATITHSGVIAGTPQYMSPEQARGEAVDGRSDLFSLGSVLYAICAGRPPFRAETTYGVMRRITDDEPTSIREINPDIPVWLCTIIARLMSKKATDRFASAEEVREMLEQCLAHVQQPATVPLPQSCLSLRESSAPFAERKGTIFRRYSFLSRPMLGVFAMIAALGLGLLGMVVWQATEAPDITGKWSGEGWGEVKLDKEDDGSYDGTYADTFGKQAGEIKLKWSRVEQRFNGTWKEGKDRFGKVSVRLAGDEIHGAWTTSKESKIDPGHPRLADLLWVRRTNKPKSDEATGVGVTVRLLLSAETHSLEMMSKNKGFDGISIMGTGISGIINGKPASNIVGVIAHKCRLESFKEIVYRGKKYWAAEFFVPQGPASGSNHFLSLSQKSLDEAMERGVEFQLDHYRGQEVQTPNNRLDRTNASSTLDAYIVAALSGETETASGLAINRPADTKQLAEFFGMLNVKTLAVDDLWIDNQAMPTKALAVSELLKLKPKQANGLREGSLVFTLTLVEKAWFVSDIDLESEEDAEEKLKEFRKGNPRALGLPPPDDTKEAGVKSASDAPKASAASPQPKSSGVFPPLEGTWAVVSVEGGRPDGRGTKLMTEGGKERYVFEGKKLVLKTVDDDGKVRKTGEFDMTLDTKVRPHRMTVRATKDRHSIRYIYDVNGDTLRLCFFALGKEDGTEIVAWPLEFSLDKDIEKYPTLLTLKRVDDTKEAGVKLAPGEPKASADSPQPKSSGVFPPFELRLAYFEPDADRSQYTVPGSEQKVFVARQLFASIADVAAARAIDDASGQPAIEITFSPNSAKRVEELTQQHLNKPVAILVDGKLLTAPIIQDRFGSVSIITGRFSREEAERIAHKIEAWKNLFRQSVSDIDAGPVWGEAVDGLQLAVSGIRQDRHFQSGDTIRFRLSVRNVGTEVVRFEYKPPKMCYWIAPQVEKANGERVNIPAMAFRGGHKIYSETLEPNAEVSIQVVGILVLGVSDKADQWWPRVEKPEPGEYRLRAGLILEPLDADGKEIIQRDADGTRRVKSSFLKSGTVTFHIDQTASEAELKKFQGSWVLVSSEKDSEEKSEAKNPNALTFTGTHWKVHHDDAVAIEGTLKLVDVASTPMKFDLLKPKGLGPDPTVDYGIYEWKENTLRYCVRNGPVGGGFPGGLDISKLRPTEFSTKNGDGRVLYVWKRAELARPSDDVEAAVNGEGKTESGPTLEFLTEFPKHREQTEGELKALTAPQFEAVAKARKLGFEKTTREGDPRYYLPTGDGHTVIVMFRDGKWSGIQRIRGEQHPEPASVETPEGPGKP